jgi:hypothetical protein
MPARPSAIELEPETQKRLGIELFNYTWTLLEKEDRTERESDRMVDAAHASRFFWEGVGQPVNHARGEWQISRVYATLGRAEPALHHACRCLEICEQNRIGAFDLAYAYEALARASGIAGKAEMASHYTKLADEAAHQIANEQDRELVLSDLARIPT